MPSLKLSFYTEAGSSKLVKLDTELLEFSAAYGEKKWKA